MPHPCRITAFRSGPIAYETAYERQLLLQSARQRGAIPDTLLLLEHEPVITIGRRSRDRSDLVADPADLERAGIRVVESDRGGEMTYHAPGQLVGYGIVDLSDQGRDLHKYLRGLEETIIEALAHYGVEGGRKDGLTGVWVGESKICAIGIKVSRWVTMHGFALNVAPDMTPFRRDFIPCGIRDKGVVSLQEIGIDASIDEVGAICSDAFCRVFGLCPEVFPEEALRSLLAELASATGHIR